MTPTLDRDVAEAIYKLLGDTYETEKCWEGLLVDVGDKFRWRVNKTNNNGNPAKFPAPDFSETIRVLKKVAFIKDWNDFKEDGKKEVYHAQQLTRVYMLAPSPDQGMKEVSSYLRKVL